LKTCHPATLMVKHHTYSQEGAEEIIFANG